MPHCYKKCGSDIYQKSNYATFFHETLTRFLYFDSGYEKSLKAVNNTPATEIWRLLICQNCQMICRQHPNISPLILMTDLLVAMHCSQKTTFHFLSICKSPTSILSAWNHFCGIFLNSHKYIQDIFLRRIRDVTEQTSFLRYVLDALETLHEKHHYWDVFETS